MKKLVLGVLAAVLVSVGMTASVKADPPSTDVTGVVTEAQTAVPSANVSVECNGKTETDTTDAHGSYLVRFASVDCPFGSTVKVTANKGSKSGVASGTVMGITTKLNLAIVNVSIPEYGLLGTIAATGIGLGLITYTRRRRQQQFMA